MKFIITIIIGRPLSNLRSPYSQIIKHKFDKTEMPKPFNKTFYYLGIIHSIILILIDLTCNNYYPSNSVQCETIGNTRTDHNKLGKQQIIRPIFLNVEDNYSPLKQTNLKNKHCPQTLRIQFSGFDDDFVIDLVKNKRLISDKYLQILNGRRDKLGTPINDVDSSSPSNDFYNNHKFIELHDINHLDDHCHYHGLVDGNVDSISAISIVNSKSLSGFFRDDTYVYYLHANDDSTTTLTRVKPGNQSSQSLPDEFTESGSESPERQEKRFRRNVRIPKRKRFSNANPDNKILHEPFQSNSNSLYVELLVVHDHNQFVEYDRNSTNIAERTMQIVNIMNAFYRQLNIFIALVGVVLWTEKDEIVLTEDGDSTLNNFLKYRYEKLLPRYHHDNAQLITSTSFNGSVVGKALKGPICTHDHSGGVNTDHSHVPAIVAVTLAHELGHNLGMEHDEDDKCKCPDEKCIMSSSSSAVHPKHWSACSTDYLEDSKKHGLLDCLMNEPGRVFGPVCGNGFVEEGEDCDMGEPMPSYGTSKSRTSSSTSSQKRSSDQTNNINPCCDRSTCKFVANATCAQGPCCDLTTCSVYNSTETKVCRPRKGECDFEEVCDGQSEYCPRDAYYHDGLECGPTASLNGQELIIGTSVYNRSRAYCYQGRCASHESQCQLLWGPTGSASKDICYDQNIHGNTSGNCGYDRKEKIYNGCEPEDSPCGMLHCVHNQASSMDSRKTGKLGYGFESASILTVSFFVMSNHAKIFCHGAIIDAGPSVRDPGLVPNGAACGDDRMCLDHKCTPVQEIVYKDWCPSDCNGNGICDNTGVCHCHDGTIGTSCYQFFGSNFHLSLFLYVIMFFVPIIALIVFTIKHYRSKIKIWWFLHNRMVALRNKAREPSHPRRMAYNADGNKVMISEPIPLNQQNNISAPFYKPDMDPWAETTGGDILTGKSPGYRLEPIKRQPERQHYVNIHQQVPHVDSQPAASRSDNSGPNMKPGE